MPTRILNRIGRRVTLLLFIAVAGLVSNAADAPKLVEKDGRCWLMVDLT
jgi:hypothetical protein